jgi:hypothetical protein
MTPFTRIVPWFLSCARLIQSKVPYTISLRYILTLSFHLRRPLRTGFFPNEVEVNLRPTVSRPVCPGVRRPSGTSDQFFFLLEISFRQLRLCHFVAPSLTRGQPFLPTFYTRSLSPSMPATCQAHLIGLDLVIQTTFCDKLNLWKFS